MTYLQKLTAPDGTELVVIPRADYDRLVARGGDDADDIRAAEAALADPVRYPAEVMDMLMQGFSPVAAWRHHRGMTQVQLAEATGISQAGVARFENRRGGKVAYGRLDTRRKLAAALDIPVGALDPLEDD